MTRILLIPGLVCDAHVWQATLAALDGYDVAVADVTHQPSITAMAEDLLARHTGDLVVIGHSMGGRVAMEMARIAPARLRGMALLNTGMAPLKEGELPKREAMIAFGHSEGMAGLAEKWLPGMMADGIKPDPQVMNGLRAMVQRMTPDIHERQIRALIARPDASQSMPAYKGPLLLITGRQDIWSPIGPHEEIARLCPQARLEIIEEAGHFAPVEQPARVAQLLAGWVAEIIPARQERHV
ncbi:alpha/beta fold hydrolase [Roseinatronobacter bogoriensis]|uniref:Alpha/beta hydrolase n=1 Tax=Roseinatronobacter bogoriensis subsp. barguzinensis TaxID=441209 RepID=A0A2K8K9T4_9RHOB|nr:MULTISPECIES: alpha/beta hydrolase [Rhodobaca]ATX65716.1 alpha/beta hydrolase [Rhodobaca barguzinensis]MBB4208338.1 pimeloyl-ACP methyl ester carboxylesterase [Rhodobaca bogoriensis DSM 18756]TDW38979.1 pimeloyl-ACP methyl ester carboxylesterase [Rhodobaca barguzinensis]TDY68838.1 pimeloyl-ACP methyl ester carboxylesterase [Rhodobaca bogoriensis DSM 18756]